MARRTPGTVRIGFAAPVAVVFGVGVDDRAERAARLGHVDLVAAVAVGLGVAHHDDLAAHVDPEFVELREVLGASRIRVDDLGRHVAVVRVGVERNLGRIAVEVAVLVARIGIFGEFQLQLHGCENLDGRRARVAHQRRRVVEVHLLEPVLHEAVAHVVGELHVARRARLVWLFGQIEQVFREDLGAGGDAENPFDVALARCGRVAVARKPLRFRAVGRRGRGPSGCARPKCPTQKRRMRCSSHAVSGPRALCPASALSRRSPTSRNGFGGAGSLPRDLRRRQGAIGTFCAKLRIRST